MERKELVLLKSAKNNDDENEIKQDSTESPIPWAIPVSENKKPQKIKKLKIMENVESKKELFFILYCICITFGVLVIVVWSVNCVCSSLLVILFFGICAFILIENSTLKDKLKINQPFKELKIFAIIVFTVLFLLYLLYLFIVCGTYGGFVLDSAEFFYDSEAEIDSELLDELYLNLDNESRMNVTNETYFLVLSIPELDYSIRFDYLFEFDGDNLTNLRIEQHEKVSKITSFERRTKYKVKGGYNLSIEFQIDSMDPDILNVSIFPPDNVIYGEIYTSSPDSWTFYIELDEGEKEGKRWENNIREGYLILPYNHRIIVKSEFHHPCPFK